MRNPIVVDSRRVARTTLQQLIDWLLSQGHTREEILLAVNTRITEHEKKAS